MFKHAIRIASIALALAAGAAKADQLASPAGAPILTISGEIGAKNLGKVAVFDRAMLEGMETTTVRTSTPWFKDVVEFQGVPMDKLMAAVGAKGEKVTVYALNDYRTEIPLQDLADHHAILAYKRDGRYMPVNDKGPLFIVYPYDSDATLQNQVYYSRSAWQVARMVVQ